MKINTWIVLLLMSLAVFTASAQDISFPISGTYLVKDEAGDREKDFNTVQIDENTFSLWRDEQLIRSYHIVSQIKGGYAVEQTVTGQGYKETFNVTIDQLGASDCYFTIHYEEGSETIHLYKE